MVNNIYKYSENLLPAFKSMPKTRAILWKVIAMLSYALIHNISKVLTTNNSILGIGVQAISVYQVIVMQYLLASVLMLPWVINVQPRSGLGILQVVRAICGGLGLFFLYISFQHMQIAKTLSITFLGPVITIAGAVWFLGEKLSLYRKMAILIGFAGYFVIVHPSYHWLFVGGVYKWGVFLLPLLSTVAFSASSLIGKRLILNGERVLSMTFISLIIIPVMFSVHAYINWLPLSMYQLVLCIIMGCLAFTAQYSYNKAISLVDVTLLIPFGYIKFIASILLAFICFHEVPSLYTLGGIGLILLALLCLGKEV